LLVINRWLVRIVNRYAFGVFVFLDVLFDLFSKLYIAAVAWTVSNDPGLDRVPDQGKITNNVEQFMSCRFIRKTKFEVIEVALALYFDLIFLKDLS
jgi:hypothetical protein